MTRPTPDLSRPISTVTGSATSPSKAPPQRCLSMPFLTQPLKKRGPFFPPFLLPPPFGGKKKLQSSVSGGGRRQMAREASTILQSGPHQSLSLSPSLSLPLSLSLSLSLLSSPSYRSYARKRGTECPKYCSNSGSKNGEMEKYELIKVPRRALWGGGGRAQKGVNNFLQHKQEHKLCSKFFFFFFFF